jgi:hypothetical protein
LPRGEAFLPAGADAGERRGEVGEAREVVHRAEVVDVLDDRARAGGKFVTDTAPRGRRASGSGGRCG